MSAPMLSTSPVVSSKHEDSEFKHLVHTGMLFQKLLFRKCHSS